MTRILKLNRLKHCNLFQKGTILMLLLFLFSGFLYSQERKITGTIVDNTGAPLLGVSVAIKGTTTGTITDIEGNFTLKIPGNDAVLVATYIGYADQQVEVGVKLELLWRKLLQNLTRLLLSDMVLRKRVILRVRWLRYHRMI